MRTTVRLPEALLAEAKRKAAAEGRTLTDLLEEGLRIVVSERSRVKRKDRTMPRLWKGVGGAAPGFDELSSSAADELDDLDRVERWSRR